MTKQLWIGSFYRNCEFEAFQAEVSNRRIKSSPVEDLPPCCAAGQARLKERLTLHQRECFLLFRVPQLAACCRASFTGLLFKISGEILALNLWTWSFLLPWLISSLKWPTLQRASETSTQISWVRGQLSSHWLLPASLVNLSDPVGKILNLLRIILLMKLFTLNTRWDHKWVINSAFWAQLTEQTLWLFTFWPLTQKIPVPHTAAHYKSVIVKSLRNLELLGATFDKSYSFNL